jgi:hypothetical protein
MFVFCQHNVNALLSSLKKKFFLIIPIFKPNKNKIKQKTNPKNKIKVKQRTNPKNNNQGKAKNESKEQN